MSPEKTRGGALEAKQELRKAHFSFGYTSPMPEIYTTTNQGQIKPSPNDYLKNSDKKFKPEKGTSIVYGKD
jgi:hypothetical protein